LNRLLWTLFAPALAATFGIGCGEDSDSNTVDTPAAETADVSTADTDETSDAADAEEADTSNEVPDYVVAADWLTGDFNSRAQSQADRRYFDVQLYAIQIWAEREDAVWMYVQQSRDDDEDGAYEPPYRQRVYQVSADNAQVVSTVYRIANEGDYVDPWNDLSVLDAIEESDLELAEGCDVCLEREGESFVGGTVGTACRLSFGGYATSSVTLTESGMQSLDLLYDDSGAIINGLMEDSEPYTFDKTENFPVE